MFRKILALKPRNTLIRQFSVCALPKELQQIQQTCRNFAERELKPVAAALDRDERFPAEQIAKLADLGLMRVMVSPEYGGSNLNMLALSLIVEELSRGCASTGAILSIHNCLYANLLSRLGTKEQKDTFFTKYTSDKIGVFALSEANAGSDVVALSTKAAREGRWWVLNGAKTWVTSAREAKSGIVFATVDAELKHKGITAFLVDFEDAEGMTIGRNEDKLGIRGSSTCSLLFDNVRIPDSNVLGPVGGGFKIAMEQLDRARIGIASQALGIAQAALETAIEYAGQRIAFGQPLLALTSVRTRIAEMAVRIQSVRLLVRKAAVEVDQGGQQATKAISMAKWVAGETATFAAHNCLQILGGMGYVKDMPAERYYRDARITEIYGGVTDVQKAIVAEHVIKELSK